MDIRNCSNCGKIYNYDGFNICIQCRRDEEKLFQKVKEYLRENPGAAIPEISEETEVESSKIIEFLRQGRLEVKDANNLILECERCEAPIRTGRFCDKCMVEMDREFKGSIGGGRDPRDLGSGDFKRKLRAGERYRKRR
ncbi:MAG: MerR family transcriptional regulator [Tissierellia bacterium]|nr:MerR family transcriptional regulator [Tissierellia bacterium]